MVAFHDAAARGNASSHSVAGRVRLLAGASAVALLLAAGTPAAMAANSTWQGATSDWNTAGNWSAGVPGSADTATFTNNGAQTAVTISVFQTAVGAIDFSATSPSFTITSPNAAATIGIVGAGVTNNSGIVQTIAAANGGDVQFENSASAGTALLTASGAAASTFLQFLNTPDASGATVQLGNHGIMVVETDASLSVGSLSGTVGSEVLFAPNPLTSPAPATITLTVGALNTSTTFDGFIAEQGTSGALVKTGTGTLTLTGSNSYSGGTTVNAGTLAITNNSALGTAGVTLSPGTTLALQGVQITNTIAVSGDPNITVTGVNSLATITGPGTVNITGTQGNVAGDRLTLTAANNYTAATNVGDGTTAHAVTLVGGIAGAFSANSVTTVTAHSILDLGGFAQTVSSLQGAGFVTNSGSNDAVLTNMGASSTFSGAIKDGLTNKVGLTQNSTTNGILTLSGTNNTYTGATTVTAGTLQGGAANAFSANSATTVNGTLDLGGFNQTVSSLSGGGKVTNNGGAAAVLTNQGASSTFSGQIQDGASTVGLTQNSAGNTLTLSGANTYSGATTITAGTLQAGNTGAFSANSVTTVSLGGTLDINGTDQNVKQLSGAGIVTNSSATSAFLINNGAGNSQFDGTITGTALKLEQNGTGKLTLTGSNSYGGSTIVNTGTLALSGGGSIASSVHVEVVGGAFFDISATNNGATIQALQTTGGPDGTVALGSKTLTIANIGAAATFSGIISGNGGLTIAQGEQDLGGANAYTGATNIQNGATLKFATGGSINAASVTTVAGTLDLGTTAQTINTVNLTGGTIQNGSLAGAVFSSGGFIAGLIGSASVAINSGTTTLSGTNNGYTGGTFVNAGILTATNSNAFSAASTTAIGPGGTVDLGGVNLAQTINTVNLAGGALQHGALTGAVFSTGGSINGLTGSASVTTTAGQTTLSGANGYTGATNVNGGTLTASTANAFSAASTTTINTGGTVNLGGVAQTINTVNLAGGTLQGGSLTGAVSSTGGFINGLNGAATLTTTAGTTTLSAANGYTGITTVAGGTLTAANANAFSAVSVTTIQTGGTINLGGFAQTINTLDLAGGTLTNGSLAGAVSSTGGIISGLGGSMSLTTISGTTTLLGTNTFTGATNLSNGTLLVGSATGLSAGSSLTIGPSGTLNLGGFTVTINSATLDGGTITNGSLLAGINSIGGTIGSFGGASTLTITSGVTTLTGTGNTFTGATTVNGGTLTANNAGAFSAASVTTINTGGTVDLGGFAQTINTVNLAGGTLQNGALTGAVASTGGFINGLTGSMTLTTTAGATSLSGANSYTGATGVNGGTLTASSANAFSRTSVTTINTGGTVDLGGFAQTINTVNLAGGTLQNGSLAGAISSTGGAIASITGSSTLTTTGGTTILAGTNVFSNVTNGVGAIIINNGTTTDDLNNAGTYTNNGTENANVASNTGTITNNTGANWNGNVNAGANTAGGLITNLGTWTGTGNNAGGTIDNSATWAGAIDNASGTFNNNAGATAGAVTNAGTGANAGTIASLSNTGGTFSNTKTITGAANVSGGTLNTTGAINGGVTNSATVNAAGTINGAIANNAGTFTVTGGLVSNGATFTNAAGATLDVKTGAFTGLATLANAGTVTVEASLAAGTINQGGPTFTIATGGSVNATTAFNQTAGLLTNKGSLTSASPVAVTGGDFENNGAVIGSVNNSAIFNNNAGASVSGAVTNSATASNAGLISGLVTNTAGTFANTGEIDGGVTNSATFNAAGTIKGAIANNGGVFTVTGALASDGVSTFTNASGATLDVKSGAFTNLATLANNAGGIVTVENTLGAATLNQSGTFTISATGVVNTTSVAQNAGVLTNKGTLTASAGVKVNGGVLNTTGAINGGVTNSSTVNAAGTINGAINNNAGGLFTVTGALADNGATFTNAASATLDVKSGAFTGLAALANAGTVTVEASLAAGTINQNGPTFTIATGGAVTATSLTQTTGLTTNNGSLTVTNPIAVNGGDLENNKTITGSVVNGATFNNNAGATVSGTVTNSATASNAGLISGLVTNTGTFANTGEIDGGVANSATFNAAGTIKGAIANNAGTFTVTSALASDGASTFTNASGATLDVKSGAFTNLASLVNSGTVTVESALTVTAFAQSAGLTTNSGSITATNPIAVNGGTFNNKGTITGAVANAATFNNNTGALVTAGLANTAGSATNAGTINGGVSVTGGKLTSTGAITGGLTNSASVAAQGSIGGGVTNSAAFVVTGALDNGGGAFVNSKGGTLSFAAGNLTYQNIGAFTNDGTVTIGQYPSNTADTIGTTTFTNDAGGIVTGVGQIVGAVSNAGAIYVGAANLAQQNGYNLTVTGALTNTGSVYLGTIDPNSANPTNTLKVLGALSGGGTIFTAADFGNARANTITAGSLNGGQIDIGLVNTNTNRFFGTLTVANFTSGGGFTDTAATQAALTNASNGFYKYSFGATPGGQGIVQIPNSAAATAPLTQVASTITALNTSFFQNSSAFLGQAGNPDPNHWAFGVWNRDAVADTNVASTSTLVGTPSSAEASHVDTRLAGFQYGVDAALFNIQNSGFNTHFGLTAGDVFTSSTDHANPGVSSTAEVPFVGAYGALTGHGFAGIVGVRYDTYRLNLTNAVEGVTNQPLGGHGLTYSGDVQYVIPLGTVAFVEPSSGIYLSHANVDNQTFAAGTNSFGTITSTLSRIGLRTGVATQAGAFLFQPFVAANLYHEWAGDARTVFTPISVGGGTGPALPIDTTRVGTFAQASVGVGWQVPGTGWTGYARSDAKFGPNIEGWTLTAGLRYNW